MGMDDITQLIDSLAAGKPEAGDQFYPLVYDELRRLARSHLRRQATLTHLDAPALVHEAYLRLTQRGALSAANRNAFFAYASAVMRSVIVDYVRERGAQKRGSDMGFDTLVTGLASDVFVAEEISALHEALEQLKRIDARLHDVVEMRYFGGLTLEDIAEVRGVSSMTVKRDWQKARAYLFEVLGSSRSQL